MAKLMGLRAPLSVVAQRYSQVRLLPTWRECRNSCNPPAELETWSGYEGSSRNLLNDSTGYLREMLTEMIGVPPPYVYND